MQKFKGIFMKHKYHALLSSTLLVSLFFLSACGSDAEPQAQNNKQQTKSFIPSYQLEALEKAKGVENTLMNANERRKETIGKY